MPKLTIAVTTNKPHSWLAFCNGLLQNSVDFEVIFIGPYGFADAPSPLPVPVKYLVTNARPALCWEMGCRAAPGDFVCTSCDDWFYSDGFFDDALELAKSSKNILDTFTGRLMTNGVDCTAGQMCCGAKNMPLLSVAGIGFTEGHHMIGGIDRRFIATLWDTDLYLRMYAAGGRPTLLPGHFSEERGMASDMSKRFMPEDHPTLLRLWTQGERFSLTRNDVVAPYSDNEAGPRLWHSK